MLSEVGTLAPVADRLRKRAWNLQQEPGTTEQELHSDVAADAASHVIEYGAADCEPAGHVAAAAVSAVVAACCAAAADVAVAQTAVNVEQSMQRALGGKQIQQHAG